MIVKIDMGYRIYVFRHILHMLSQSYTGILLEKKKKGGGGKGYSNRGAAPLYRALVTSLML